MKMCCARNFTACSRSIFKPPRNKPNWIWPPSLTATTARLGQAISTVARIAARCEEAATTQEYNDLFIGMGRGELLPYASYYLTGFLNEKPLAKLRNDMTELGIKRQEGTKEPEDHAGACAR